MGAFLWSGTGPKLLLHHASALANRTCTALCKGSAPVPRHSILKCNRLWHGLCLKPLSLLCPTGGNMIRTSIKTLGVALAAALPLLASAQLTGNVSVTTNYKFRGQDQDTSKVKAVKPALQGGFDYTFGETGFYVGNWNSSVDWLSGN